MTTWKHERGHCRLGIAILFSSVLTRASAIARQACVCVPNLTSIRGESRRMNESWDSSKDPKQHGKTRILQPPHTLMIKS